MYSFLIKNGETAAFLVGIVLTLLFIVLVVTNATTAELTPEVFQDKSPEDARSLLESYTQFDFGLKVTYIMSALATLLTIGFGLFQFVAMLIDSPKKAATTLITFVGLIVFFFIGKSMASAPDTAAVLDASANFGVTETQRGLISGSINLTLITLVVAIVALVVLEIRNIFK